MKNWMTITTAALVITMSAHGQSAAAMEQTHAMAAKAKTASNHATVAKQYRLQAEAFSTRAAEHEKDVADYTRAAGASIHKWPGSASGLLQKAKANAVEARKAAREASALADRHIRLAVEAQATDQAVVGN
jgi:hypothetical protein